MNLLWCVSFYLFPGTCLGNSEDDVESHTDSDHRYRVSQTHHQEELATQQRDKLWLTSSAFQEAATQQTHTDTDAESAEEQPQLVVAGVDLRGELAELQGENPLVQFEVDGQAVAEMERLMVNSARV